MAVVKGTFGTNLKGRVGSVVYRNRNGVNVASQIPASVKNPQSILQQQQRMKFHSVSQAYSCLKSLVDHSFEGVTYGAPSMAKFMKDNTLLYTLDGPNHGMVAKNNKAIPMGNFKISEGSLPSVGYQAVSLIADPANILGARVTGLLFSNVMTGADGDISNVSVAQFLQAFGIQKGDQVTILVVRTKDIQSFGANNTIPQCINTELIKCSFTVAIDADDANDAFLASANSAIINPAILAESDNLSYFGWSETADYKLQVVVNNVDIVRYANIAWGAIVSRKVGMTWQRSTQYINAVPSTMWTELLPAEKPEYNYPLVVLTYEPSSEYYLNGE